MSLRNILLDILHSNLSSNKKGLISTKTTNINWSERKIEIGTNQPFLVTLKTFLVKPLNGNDQASTGLSCFESILINPTLEDASKTAFSDHTVGTEVPGGGFEVIEA